MLSSSPQDYHDGRSLLYLAPQHVEAFAQSTFGKGNDESTIKQYNGSDTRRIGTQMIS